MKRRCKRVVAVMILLGLPLGGFAADWHESRADLCLTGNLFFSADPIFRDIYGRSMFLPQIDFSYSLSDSVYLWTDLAFMTSEGFIAEIDEKSSVSQLQFGAGIGYRIVAKAPFRVSLEAGAAMHRFSEKTMGEENSGSSFGWRAGINIDYALARHLFLRLGAALKQVSRSEAEIEMKLGGTQLGVGIGYAF